MKAYDRHGQHSMGIGAVIEAVRPFIVVEALREAATVAEKFTMVYDQDSDDGWRAWMRERADAIERGEVQS